MSLDPMDKDTRPQELWDLCQAFIEKQRIQCPEAVHQSDRVIENAYQLIEEICEIVGYQKDDDDKP